MSKGLALLIFVTFMATGMDDIKSRDFFLHHPEMVAGEKCIGNYTPREFDRLEYKTKRMGDIAYNRDGIKVTELGFEAGQYMPVFVSTKEYEAQERAKETRR